MDCLYFSRSATEQPEAALTILPEARRTESPLSLPFAQLLESRTATVPPMCHYDMVSPCSLCCHTTHVQILPAIICSVAQGTCVARFRPLGLAPIKMDEEIKRGLATVNQAGSEESRQSGC